MDPSSGQIYEKEVVQTPGGVSERVEVRDAPVTPGEDRMGKIRRVQRAIWFVCGGIQVAILFRFTLMLGGADPRVGFADFVYSVSYPLVAPFLALFGREPSYGNSIFEFSDLVAAVAYLVLAAGLSGLTTLLMSPNDPTGESYT
jgi:drug/metabolite transporter (DMT)-like permease